MSLAAKTILITGASRGLGLEFIRQAVKLPSAPEVLIATCRNPDGATDLQAMAKSYPSIKIIKMDVQNDEEIDNAYKSAADILGDRGLNLLVNNAALNQKNVGTDLRSVSRSTLNLHMDVNCTGPVIVVQKFLPLLEKAAAMNESKVFSCSKCAVVIISSTMASMELTFKEGKGNSFPYKCSKAAVNMATILMHRQLSPIGILAMAIHPGWVKTDMGGNNAPVTTEESISNILKLLANAGEVYQGKLYSYTGEILPY